MSTKKRMNKDELISRSGEIADAFSVFIAAGGNVAVWVLFVCMIANIIDAAVNFPTAVSVAIMVIQAVVLDIAGFGLQTIAKRLLKVKDLEVQQVARKGKKFAGWLIFVMIVTMILITSKTLTPVIVPLFTKNIDLVGSIQNTIDIIDKVLVLARIGFTVAYVHTIHNLREIEADIQQTEDQQQQANDQLTLQVANQLKQLTGIVEGLRTQLGSLSTNQQKLYTQIADVSTKYTDLDGLYTNLYTDRNNDVDMDVYTARLDKLEKMFNGLNVSVTNINNNVQTMTQNVAHNVAYTQTYTPAPKPAYNGFTGRTVPRTEPHSVVNATKVTDVTNEMVKNTVSLPQVAETQKSAQALVPVLDVVGVNPEKVSEILAAYLSHGKWRDCPGNYSRSVKPVRDAYEAYLASGVHNTVDA